MATSSSFIITLLFAFSMSCTARLSQNYYSKSCPNILDTVKSVVESAVSKESRMGASILRLHFHDCFINGCDGSILLDETSSMKSEKFACPNNNSARGFDVIDDIKFKVEQVCPDIVSCADILTIATRDSVVLLGGPNWDVKLGRRDSKTANFSAAENGAFIPSPASNLSSLISIFQAQRLSVKDMIALSGAHTIGQAKCAAFRHRVYDAININIPFAKVRQQKCPKSTGSGDNNLADLDIQTPNKFDSSYFKLLVDQKGLLNSDQELFNGGSTDSLVKKYSNNEKAFYDDFVKAMIKMGNIKPLTGSEGEIRKDCRKAN